ncbi:protein of unknown function DUF262 [Brachyspira murdochii DSM 12563]|uniref:GmrSD restriction endonucleases N-terminal domain-containing protein n=1 Tax=Brachyspira murdochii (strain ATCC 51284 / DSM 12563 / 56-150) TaxID=526224 RepID=D5U9S0_BRAM5|nr:protein of unknown function DUF262 [Brachyspira murdochii DSM 12563]
MIFKIVWGIIVKLETIENGFIPINELSNKNFFIPSYQRGYRWDNEVNALLGDITDFINYKESDNDFYSLQPIVVKKYKDKYIVIDGQQRLTTIFLIIKYIQNQSFFSIEYETRKQSSEFLENIQSKKENDAKNIDFYYFFQAYKNISDFFSSKVNKNNFYNILLNNCKVLWYEISYDEKEEDVFIRLNIGKIPLLDEENIKALFLSKSNGIENIDEIAEKWYDEEKELRYNNDYRYCVLKKIDERYITKENNTLNDDFLRIRVYLEAIMKNKNYSIFEYFYKLYKENKLKETWENLESCIDTLNSFSSDQNGIGEERNIFHYIGFLILNNIMDINDIYKIWIEDKNKINFSSSLKKSIEDNISLFKSIKDNDFEEDLRELNFNDKNHKKIIYKILVLFNIAYLLKDEGSHKYFEFNRFQLEQWSIEHIYAQNSKSIKEDIKNKDNEKIIYWLKEVSKYCDELKPKIEELINKKNPYNEKLFDEIDNYFKDEDSLNGIGNLCLLDKQSNIRIGNMIFSSKRLEIERLGQQGKLIPICTKLVFEKFFSDKIKNKDYFLKEDREYYIKAIIEKLQIFFKQ